ncbi:hypothetical protein [Gottfriedia acidiceleris]|uniref:hypothetical protein n=1 Tax=Gottfriedia acidiceleris TaxID=371036 RepID=UPI0030008218
MNRMNLKDIFVINRVKDVSMEKICGKCAKNIGMTKEDRLELAKSRISNKVHL